MLAARCDEGVQPGASAGCRSVPVTCVPYDGRSNPGDSRRRNPPGFRDTVRSTVEVGPVTRPSMPMAATLQQNRKSPERG